MNTVRCVQRALGSSKSPALFCKNEKRHYLHAADSLKGRETLAAERSLNKLCQSLPEGKLQDKDILPASQIMTCHAHEKMNSFVTVEIPGLDSRVGRWSPTELCRADLDRNHYFQGAQPEQQRLAERVLFLNKMTFWVVACLPFTEEPFMIQFVSNSFSDVPFSRCPDSGISSRPHEIRR